MNKCCWAAVALKALEFHNKNYQETPSAQQFLCTAADRKLIVFRSFTGKMIQLFSSMYLRVFDNHHKSLKSSTLLWKFLIFMCDNIDDTYKYKNHQVEPRIMFDFLWTA